MSDQGKIPNELRGLLIQLEGDRLLLPNAAVAELIDYRTPTGAGSGPGWYLGSISWRQRSLPVVRLEHFLGAAIDSTSQRQRIVVCHTLGDNAKRPFLGIIASAIPRLIRVREENIEGQSLRGGEDQALVHARVTVDGQDAVIPNLSELERRVHDLI